MSWIFVRVYNMIIYSPPWVYRKPKPQIRTQQSPPWFCAFCLSNTSLHGLEISISSFEFDFGNLFGIGFIFFFFMITVEGANVAAETVWGRIQRRLPHRIMCSPFFGDFSFWSSSMGVSGSTSWSNMEFKFRSWSCRRFNCWWNTWSCCGFNKLSKYLS